MSAETQIRVLSSHVINKIAAGEVVERPASVLKEILENALDAEATQLDVRVVGGGRKLVAVSDNGRGMRRDDVLLCVERHATSKIADVDDIEQIATLGFRGEALAAIGAVSRFRVVTCSRGDVGGTELTITGGKVQDVRAMGCPEGTLVEVRDLFFNVPARRKFLRSQQTELGHVRACFLTQALAHPDKGMSLNVDGRMVYQLAAGATLTERVRDLFGPDYQKQLRPVDFQGEEVRVVGLVGTPSLHRADRREQYCFINGRAAGAAVLNYAVREGFHDALPGDRHPCVFLFICMDPGLVDVNVHPTKKDVRFRHPGAVRDTVIEAIQRALRLPMTATEDFDQPFSPPAPDAGEVPAGETQLRIDDLVQPHTFRYPRMGTSPEGDDEPAAAPLPDAASPARGEQVEAAPATATGPWSWCRVLGQIGGLYVVMETGDGMVLMDPRAAHERVLYERLRQAVSDGRTATQALLVPETVDLGPQRAARLRKVLGALQEMGFGISEFGPHTFVVDAVPAGVSSASAAGIIEGLLAELEASGETRTRATPQQDAILKAACRAAVQSRDRLSLEEIEKLVVDLAGTEMPYTSPRGRPTVMLSSIQELHKKFGR